MGGQARTPEGDEPAYAGFEGGLEGRIRQLELENDILGEPSTFLKAGGLGSMSNMEKTALIDKPRRVRPPLKRARRFLEDLEELL